MIKEKQLIISLGYLFALEIIVPFPIALFGKQSLLTKRHDYLYGRSISPHDNNVRLHFAIFRTTTGLLFSVASVRNVLF